MYALLPISNSLPSPSIAHLTKSSWFYFSTSLVSLLQTGACPPSSYNPRPQPLHSALQRWKLAHAVCQDDRVHSWQFCPLHCMSWPLQPHLRSLSPSTWFSSNSGAYILYPVRSLYKSCIFFPTRHSSCPYLFTQLAPSSLQICPKAPVIGETSVTSPTSWGAGNGHLEHLKCSSSLFGCAHIWLMSFNTDCKSKRQETNFVPMNPISGTCQALNKYLLNKWVNEYKISATFKKIQIPFPTILATHLEHCKWSWPEWQNPVHQASRGQATHRSEQQRPRPGALEVEGHFVQYK